MPFVHLPTHSEYSLLDGANRIPDLLGRIQTLGMDSLAITDHGNLHGAWQFYNEAKARGVRPILGFEAYLAFGSRHKREKPVDVPAGYSHLVLLAKNRVGYSNLIKLSSIGFLEGFYRRPRIDRAALEQHRDGLIGLAACLSGEVALYLRQGNYESAKASARYFAQLFGRDGFWLEVQDHGLPEERVVAAGMFRLAQELGLPVVVTNDAHYLRKDDAEAHDVLLAIGTGKDLDDPNRFRFFGQESYVKSEAEMQRLFPEHPEVVPETARLAELCEFDFEKRYFLPQFPRAPEFASDNDLLVHLARAGARARYGEPLPSAVEERLAYELGVISHTGYAGYFLIVSDITTAARARGIPVGRGGGEGAGPAGGRGPGRAGAQDPRLGHKDRGPGASRVGARGGRRDRPGPAHRLRPRVPRPTGSGRDHHPVRHGGARAGGDVEDRHPGLEDPHRDPRYGGDGAGATRRDARHGDPRPRGPRGVPAAARRPYGGRVPIRVSARHRLPAQHAVRPVRRPGGGQRAAPARAARHGDASRVHQPQARPRAGALPAPRARRNSQADVRRDHLSRAGDADRERTRGILARGSRRAAQGGRQEGQGADPAGAGPLRHARGRARAPAARDRRHRRPD